MLRSKKSACLRAKLKKHNNQDTRVTVDNQDSKKERKDNRIKRLREVVEAFVIRQVILDLWENRVEYWELACDKAVKLIEVLTS